MFINFEIRNSPIAGNGVFAKREFKKGEQICFLIGERISLEEMIKRADEKREEPSDPLQIDFETYIDLDEIPRTFNHSCDPNTYIRNENELVALQDIQKGEELVFDYSTTMYDNIEKILKAGREIWTCKCNCGSNKCRGIIDQFKTLPRETQKFYLSNKYAPDFILRAFS
jgi:hypothetical protein